MTLSSVDRHEIHDVTSISVGEVLELEGFNSIIHARHIKIICTDSQGGAHYHAINMYGETSDKS